MANRISIGIGIKKKKFSQKLVQNLKLNFPMRSFFAAIFLGENLEFHGKTNF
jgi:hypothetical protein